MSTYIIHRDNDPNSLTHYGVKGMKWRKRKAKALDLAWEIAHPIKGATHEKSIETYGSFGSSGAKVTQKESRRYKTTTTYKKENGK